MSTSKQGFSLLELLVVMAVMAILVTLSAATMRSNPAISLSNAGDKVALLAQQARHTAKTHRSLTALVLVTGADIKDSDNETLNYRLMGILELQLGDTAWRMISRWETLPQGVTVDPVKSSAFAQSDEPQVPFPELQRGEESIAPASYVCQVFLPSGQLLQQNLPPLLYLRMIRGDGENFYKVILSPTTGTTLLRRPGNL